MSSKKYKFVRKVRNIKKHGWLKLKITVATSVVLSGVFLLLLIVTCIGNVTSAILALGGSSGGSGESIRGCKDISGEVLAWQQVITDQCRQWMWTEEYVPVVMAICMVESGGRSVDIMQCSESSFNTQYSHSPGSIASTEYSIQVGVRTLKSLLDLVGCNGLYDTDHLYLALQCYNFGPGFYDYCNKYYGGKYTEQAAQQFSLKMRKEMGWEVYGNPNYVNRIKDYLDIEKAAGMVASKGYYSNPLESSYMTVISEFGYRDFTDASSSNFHGGLDLNAARNASVYAAADGEVVSISTRCTHNYGKDNGVDPCDNDWGNYIKIRHKNGTCTLYAHLGYVNVSMGQQVKKGQVIGYAGSTGPSTGYHLHFEIYDTSNTRIDPTPYLVFER